ncbi:MAG: polysaccharide deacetylase family protein [Bacteroidales bacterium]|nr:polysaccharide deacetylase family protein [Bacteroidales bacterium]
MKTLLAILLLFFSIWLFAQPTISFTFDDGVTRNHGGYKFEDWNSMLLNNLDEAKIKAVFFVTTNNKSSSKGQYLLQEWDSRGHKIANHTHSHPNFSLKKNSAAKFKQELLKADSVICNYSNYTKLFRFPYLKEGENKAKVDSIRYILKEQEYKNGYVTIDASDWYIDSRLRKRLKQDPNADIEGFKNYYLKHLLDRANYYEKLSFELTDRHINHTLLLHHNLAAALFLDDLIDMFKSEGWNVISADVAFQDSIYNETPTHAGESLIWSLAKDSGKYELRYPAEDGRYEKDKMDVLGL